MDQTALRAIAYYEFLQGKSIKAAIANMCSAFKANIYHYSMVSRWYQHFRFDNTSFEIERVAAENQM